MIMVKMKGNTDSMLNTGKLAHNKPTCYSVHEKPQLITERRYRRLETKSAAGIRSSKLTLSPHK